MDDEAGRLAAYADLVAAVLDLRSPEVTRSFDAALFDAVADGVLPNDFARQLRWLQRESERAVVEQAETVLPPALVALQRSTTPSGPLTAEDRAEPPIEQRPDGGPLTPAAPAAPADITELAELGDFDDVREPEAAAVVQLPARRLLVAGLRPLPDPAHRGTLPS